MVLWRLGKYGGDRVSRELRSVTRNLDDLSVYLHPKRPLDEALVEVAIANDAFVAQGSVLPSDFARPRSEPCGLDRGAEQGPRLLARLVAALAARYITGPLPLTRPLFSGRRLIIGHFAVSNYGIRYITTCRGRAAHMALFVATVSCG